MASDPDDNHLFLPCRATGYCIPALRNSLPSCYIEFRGSTPSLPLRSANSLLPASSHLLPLVMWDSVTGWRLTFTRSGLSPLRITKLAWRTSILNFLNCHQMSSVFNFCHRMSSKKSMVNGQFLSSNVIDFLEISR